MKNNNLIYLILALGISSGSILVNRFIIPLPDWFGIAAILLSAISFGVFIAKSFRKAK